MQRYFQLIPPTMHQLVLNLHRAKLIDCVPGRSRSVQVLINPDHLATLK